MPVVHNWTAKQALSVLSTIGAILYIIGIYFAACAFVAGLSVVYHMI